MLYPQAIILMGCLMVQLNNTDFYIPTLVNYLKDSFSIQTSRASLFFLPQTLGYIICTQVINQLTDLCNNFRLMFIGHIFGAFCCLLTAPIGILPQSYIFIIIGIFLQGFVAGMINIPGYVELNNFGKYLYPNNSLLSRDIPSSLFNFSFFVGDLIEPVLGSWINFHFGFHMSAYFASFLSIIMAFILYYIIIILMKLRNLH
jgi:MFS family permease